MDDVRIEWLRNEVYLALEIADWEVFEELLSRDEGANESLIQKYLNDTPAEGTALIFHSEIVEEEEEIEVEIEPEIPIIPEGDDLFDGENNSVSETKDGIPNSSIQPPEVPTKSKDASEGDINPETGEMVQDEKHVAEEEDHKQELILSLPLKL
ncbi:uncharacterized protein LOC124434028 [Xenia sp. Carnegie-2017]|uniref:uncharacterized protein LOC124434028 n=1 Tax=Xenia sp. Carnegie-2017 TaxID=2897299 RepID=UPI001F04EB57|nr:uncharacterized protein LOC124434028 [Xenia sp. Carnegie-2017]